MPQSLHEAVKALHVEAVRAALERGASPNELDAEGRPPLAYLFEENGSVIGFMFTEEEEAIVKALLAAGANPHLKDTARMLIDDASGRVTSALEAGEFRYFESLLGMKSRP